MTDRKESPLKETDRLSRAWPEGVLPTRGEQLAGLIVLDQCGLVSRERWHRWAETQAVVDRAFGAAEPFTAGMDGDFHAWLVRRCEAVGVAVTATSEEGEELARQCLYHEAFEFYDALRRPTPLLETLAAFRKVYGTRWWMEDLDGAVRAHPDPVPDSATSRDVPWLREAAKAHITVNVQRRQGPLPDKTHAAWIFQMLPDWRSAPALTLAEYRDLIASAALPTAAQMEHFIDHVFDAEDWDAALPAGAGSKIPFTVFIDPHAGLDRVFDEGGRTFFLTRTKNSLQAHRSWRETSAYRQRLGFLAFACPLLATRYRPVTHNPSRMSGRYRTMLLDTGFDKPMVWDRRGSMMRLPVDMPTVELAREALVDSLSPERRAAYGHLRQAVHELIRKIRPAPAYTSNDWQFKIVRSESDYALVRMRQEYRRGHPQVTMHREIGLLAPVTQAPAAHVDLTGRNPGCPFRVIDDENLCAAALHLLRLKNDRAHRHAPDEIAWMALEVMGRHTEGVDAPAGAFRGDSHAQNAKAAAGILEQLGVELARSGRHGSCAVLMLDAAASILRIHDPAGYPLHRALSHKGYAYFLAGDYAKAAACYRDDVVHCIQHYQARDGEYLQALHNLGVNLTRAGQAREGEEFLRRSLMLQIEHRTTSRRQRAETAWMLAQNVGAAGEARLANGWVANDEAMELLELALVYSQGAGRSDELLAASINKDLASLASLRGQNVRALKAYKCALDALEKHHGIHHAETRQLAALYYDVAQECDDRVAAQYLLEKYDV